MWLSRRRDVVQCKWLSVQASFNVKWSVYWLFLEIAQTALFATAHIGHFNQAVSVGSQQVCEIFEWCKRFCNNHQTKLFSRLHDLWPIWTLLWDSYWAVQKLGIQSCETQTTGHVYCLALQNFCSTKRQMATWFRRLGNAHSAKYRSSQSWTRQSFNSFDCW